VADNGTEQGTVVVEQTNNKPLAVVLVMQTGAAARLEFQRYHTVTTLLEITANEPNRKVGLVTFDSKPRQIWNFPERSEGVRYAMDNPDAGDNGAAIFDALSKASDLLEEQSPEMRRLIVLLSQPKDAGSSTSPRLFMQRMGRINAPIYSISFPPAVKPDVGSSEKICLSKDRLDPSASTISALVFNGVRKRICHDTAAELASASGGEHVQIRSQHDLDQSVLRLKNTFSNAYTLSFRPASPTPGFHFLRLTAGKKADHLVAASRNLYWVP